MSEIFANLNSIVIKTGSPDEKLQQEARDQLQEVIGNINTILENRNSISFAESLKDAELSKRMSYFLDKFSSIPKHISDLRSNFIPVEVLNPASTQFSLGSTDVGGDASYVPDNFSLMESYENAFMRILGMPESADISPDEDIFIIGPDFSISKTKGGDLFSEAPGQRSSNGLDILDERQRTASDRLIYLESNFYTQTEIAGAIEPDIGPAEPEPAAVGTTTPQQTRLSSVDINFDHSKLTNILYLKCLPIQDSRFLKCISETGKIVSKPFDDRMIKVVNKEKIKTSFLENVIRLRLDKISGMVYSQDEISDSAKSGSTYTISGINSFSIFERLLFDRLSSMLNSVSSQYYITLKQAVEEAEKQINRRDLVASSSTNSVTPAQTSQTDLYPEINELKKSLDVQDAILYILKDTSISSYLYELNSVEKSQKTLEGYIRNSSGFDDRISESIISIIEAEASIYRDLINKKVSDSKPAGPNGGGSNNNADVPKIITGSDSIPIGLVDIIVYALALFSMDEYSLINLLNSKQKEILAKTLSKNATVDSLFSSNDLNMTSPVPSINKLTIYIYLYYNLFIDNMRNERRSEYLAKTSAATINDADGTQLNTDGEEDIGK